MILRLLTPTHGSVMLDGRNCLDKKRFSNKEFRTMVQPIFQNPFEAFSTRRQVEKYLIDTARSFGGAKSYDQAVEKADKALRTVGLSYEAVRGKYSTQFSGGELQRVSIARALITSPKLIIADEPVAMIDASMKMNIINLFKQIRDEYGISFIYITHDLSTAYYVSDYIATLYRGSLIEFGRASSIMENPAHPYTELLMNSVPHVGDKWKKNIRMSEGETKEFNLTCCKFASRCPYATDICKKERPKDRELNADRKVLCFHPLVK
jgi:peptide/nickel transport system ATP-binding protein